MKTLFIVCVIAVIALVGDAQTKLPVVLPTKPPVPAKRNPHGCNCKDECKDLRHSQLPFHAGDYHEYLSYENFPILCRDASSTFFGKKKYLCKQTFDCCRWCNALFYQCLKLHNLPYGNCMRSAYKCMCRCIDKHSFRELPYKGK